MKLGDRVEYIGTDMPELIGKRGYLRTAMRGYAGVEFDEEVPDGHDLNGRCPEGKGLYLAESDISVVPKFSLGQTVYCITDNRYGLHGKIVAIEDGIDSDDNAVKIYTISDEDGYGFNEYEQNLVSEEEFVPCPVNIGQMVKLKNNGHYFSQTDAEHIQNHYFGYPKSVQTVHWDQIERNFIISVGLDGDCIHVTSPEGVELVLPDDMPDASKNFAEFFIEEVNWRCDRFRREFSKGILHDISYSGSGRASDFRCNILKMLIAMLYMPTPEEVETMGVELQDYIHQLYFNTYLFGLDDTAREEGFTAYRRAGYYWLLLPLVNEDTKEKFEATLPSYDEGTKITKTDYGVYIEESGEYKHQIIYYDPFNFETAIEGFIEAVAKPESELYQLLKAKQYFDAFELFCDWNNQVEESLVKTQKLFEIQNSLAYLATQEAARIEEELDDIQRSIKSHQDSLGELFAEEREAQLKLIGAKNGQDNEMNNLLLQFLTGMGDDLISLNIDDGMFTVHLKQPLLYMDTDLYNDTHIRDEYVRQYNKETMDIVDDIINGKVTLLMEETVSVGLRSNFPINCRQRGSTASCREVKQGVPNPHHYQYNCWGQNENPIRKAFGAGNYIVGLNQIMAAVSGLNVADGAVMSRFVEMIDGLKRGDYVFWNENPCLNYQGKNMTVAQYAQMKREEQ